MVETNVFSLSFISNTSQSITINIPRANKSLSAANAQTGMNNLIACMIIETPLGRPAQIDGVDLITTQLEKLI